MNYEQKYKEDLEAAKGWLAIAKENDNKIAIQILERFFPELKESEDEQHRKWILEYLYDGLRKSDEQFKDQFNAAIAWLEKQGENFPYWKPSEEQLEALDYAFNLCPDTERGNYYEGVLETLIEDLHRLEKQKEVKMIQWTGDNLKEVTNFTGLSPEFSNWFKSWDDFESYVHSHNDVFKLFFEDGSHYEVPKGAWIVRTPDGYNVASRSKFVEKQGEQKPVKSEQNCYHNDGLYYAIDILEKTFGKVEGYQSDDGKMEHQIAIETVNALYHKKPVWWSEEDEAMRQDTINALQLAYPFALDENPRKKNIDWLKSLKGRVQPKQEWGEEDEKWIDRACSLLNELNDLTHLTLAKIPHNVDEIIEHLKSLKPRWKPTKEQLEALWDIIPHLPNCEEDVDKITNLSILYEELKTLRDYE